MRPSTHPSDNQLDAATWCHHLVADGVGVRLSGRPSTRTVPSRVVCRLGGPRAQPSVGPDPGGRHGDGATGAGGLSDREAISVLRRDIAWKVACGLRLDDEGFHPRVLVYWRARLRASQRPRRILEAVRQVVDQTGVLKGRGRRVLDSTVLETRSPPRTRSPSWSRRSAGSAGCARSTRGRAGHPRR